MFIDTNVLVNSRILEAPDHQIARSRLERAFRESEPLRISRQVVRGVPVSGYPSTDLGGRHRTARTRLMTPTD